MKTKTLLLLGGYGGVGRIIAKMLLEYTDVNIIIAGHREEEAEKLATKLNKEFNGKRASSSFADTNDLKQLKTVLKNIDMVVVTVASTPHIEQMARLAVEANIDWLDIFFRANAYKTLKKVENEINKAKLCFITQGGFHPGLPAAFVRHASTYIEKLTYARVAMAMNARFNKAESAYEVIDEFKEWKVDIFRDKKWRRATFKDIWKVNFGENFGEKNCFPLEMEEMKTLPKHFPLEDTGVYVAGFNWLVDNFIFPIILIGNKINARLFRHSLAVLFKWGVNNFSSEKQGVAFLLEAHGTTKGKTMNVRILAEHKNAYLFTAAPVVACLMQYLDNKINKTGLHMMGHLVDPARLFKDLEKMGLKFSTEVHE